ncbi:MAG: M23 family metallopeptidase, partial [Oscillospiraceae bacterium]
MSKNTGFMSGKGFYVALAVCLLGAGSAAWVAVDRTLSSVEMTQPIPNQVQEEKGKDFLEAEDSEKSIKPTEKPIKEQPKAEEVKQPSKPQENSAKLPAQSSSSAEQSDSGARQVLSPTQPGLAFCLPISSEITKNFSGDNLVKSTTLKEWRVHNGIDIAAKEGDTILSAFAGQVTKIYGDPMWGNVVEV